MEPEETAAQVELVVLVEQAETAVPVVLAELAASAVAAEQVEPVA